MDGNFWQSKRVAILGGASLIGSHLAEALVKADVAYLSISDDLSAGKYENVKELVEREGVEFRNRELRDFFNAKQAIHKADIVFHMAAQHGGRGYVATHDVELYNNLELDTTIFRACAGNVERVIFSSSACAYPVDMQTNIYNEVYLTEMDINYQNMLQADGAYGTEKLVGEQMLDAYIRKGAFKGCSTRSFTVYGPRMTESHAIAAFIAKTMLQQDPFEVWGDGEQIRNWTYVEDNVEGAMLAAEKLDRGAINIGIEDRLTPRDAILKIWNILGWIPRSVDYKLDKPVGPRNRVANADKLYNLGWRPKYTFEEGLRKTIDWYTSTHSVDELRETLERKLTER
jgi:nucleoside-diphosphate-sugar epimerase